MEVGDAILLGIVQGLTEFIPVSSSGHLILLDEATGVKSSFSFDVLLNIGTLLALLIYFRKRIAEILINILVERKYRLAMLIIISTIPAVIIGGLYASAFDDEGVRNLNVVVGLLLLGGAAMIALEKMVEGSKRLEQLSSDNAFLIGLAQALALIPGTSRSGATIIAGRLSRLSYEQAAEYSFLIAIPILSGALVRSLFESDTRDVIADYPMAVFIGVLASFITGFIAIRFMLAFLQRRGLKFFGIYRIVVGLTLLLFVG